MPAAKVDDLVRRGVLPPPVKMSPGLLRWSWESVQMALASLEGRANDAAFDPYLEGARNATKAAREGQRGPA